MSEIEGGKQLVDYTLAGASARPSRSIRATGLPTELKQQQFAGISSDRANLKLGFSTLSLFLCYIALFCHRNSGLKRWQQKCRDL